MTDAEREDFRRELRKLFDEICEFFREHRRTMSDNQITVTVWLLARIRHAME